MRTAQTKVYSFEELSKEAQKKAVDYFRETNDFFFLEDCMNERLHKLLQENKIKDDNDTSEAGTKPTQVFYSLSYSQGDGAMFEGVFFWKSYTAVIKQSGHYNHYNSKIIELYSTKTGKDAKEDVYTEFNDIYINICKQLEDYGYSIIEEENSEEHIKDMIHANEYEFISTGELTPLWLN